MPSTISDSIPSRDTERERAAYQQMTATHASHNQSHSFPAAVLEMTSMPDDLIGRLDAVGSDDASAKLWVANLFPLPSVDKIRKHSLVVLGVSDQPRPRCCGLTRYGWKLLN